MNIMYFEDIEVGQKRIKSLTYQVKKEEIIEFARHWTHDLFILTKQRQYRPSLEDSLPVPLIFFYSFVVWHTWQQTYRVDGGTGL